MKHPSDLLTISGEPTPDDLAARFPRLESSELSAVPVHDRSDALHDPLTRLATRRLLVRRLEQAAQDPEEAVAVLFVDIDQFSTINASYGRRAGDELLIAVAGRLDRLVRPEDTLARPENDTFVMICRHLDDSKEAESRTARIELVSNGVFQILDTRISVGCTVGALFIGSAADIPAQILDRTGAAIHRARANKTVDSEIIDLTAESESR